MKFIVFKTLACLASVVTATVLACLFQTQFVISDLNNIGANINVVERLKMTGYDISNLSMLYGIFIFIGLGIAFLAGALLYKIVKTQRVLIYMVAGMACFIVMLFLMKQVFFGVSIIAGSRSGLGLAFQAFAGGIAGYLFARLTAPVQIKAADK